MFEKASRLKLRFESSVGILSVEDLWSLPLSSVNKPNLNSIAVALYTKLQSSLVSFVEPVKLGESLDTLRLDIVKHIIGVKIAERDAAQVARERDEKKVRLMELIANKQDQELQGKSLDDLKAMLASL